MKHLLTLFIFVVIALVFWGLQNYEEDTTATDKMDAHFVDLFMHNFTLTATDESGIPSYTLQASYLEHYNDETHSSISEPVINFLHENNRWLITAKTGELDKENNLITLHNNVIMQQQGVSSPINIMTSELIIDTDKNILSSHGKVDIIQKDLKLESDGMILNNSTRELELLASVKGRYVQAK